jgi:ATP-dependent DNA helicase RecG
MHRMPVAIASISDEQRQKILGMQEGHFLDFKSKRIAPAKLTKIISAFANADGGEFYVGVDENKVTDSLAWNGFDREEDANAHLQVFDHLFPLGTDFEYTFLKSDGAPGLVLQVAVRKTKDVKKSSDGTPYLRRGAQSIPVLTNEELQRLQYQKGIASFETELVNTDPVVITNSTILLQFMLDIVPSAEPEAWVKKQQLLQTGKPSVAGVLLFSEEPQAVLPKRCSIKVYRYKTSDNQGSRDTLAFDPITIEGCIFDQIKAAVAETVTIIEGMSVLGDSGLEKVHYPLETLHEIITNAVLHRDYSIADDVHVRVFENRIEVESPGRLPAHITVKNILDERFARNGTIVRLINKFPEAPNKDVGEGLNTAFEAMRKLHLKPPEVAERENSVIVFIRHEPLATPEEMVMQYLDANNQINNSSARELCHIGSENVMKRVFERLMERDMIERIPSLRGRAAAYRKKASGAEAREGPIEGLF